MKQCENCGFYSKKIDDWFGMYDDTKPIGKEHEIRHSCSRFNCPVSESIFSGIETCNEYYPKSEIEEFLNKISKKDLDILTNSESDEEIERIIAKYSD